MNENILKAVEYAFDNNVSDMQDEINNALLQKVADAISGKRIEVAQTMMSPAVSESDENDFEDEEEDEEDEDEDEKPKKKLKGKQKETNESYIEEKLSASDDISVWIKDFIESDNPRFDGKSKEERKQMALGAYYSAKKGKTRNEEVEELEELSKDTLNRYINRARISKHDNLDAAKSAEAAAFKMKDDRIGDWKSMKSQEDSHNRIVKNREKGIERAAKKLTKNEEVEELEELSKDLLHRYYSKAAGKDQNWDKRAKGKLMASRKVFPRQYANSDLKVKVPATEKD